MYPSFSSTVQHPQKLFLLIEFINENNSLYFDSSKPIYDRFKSKFKEWEKDMIDPIFMDLGMGKEYNKLNPDRWYKSIKEKQ